jgi:hypothetical protein
MKVTDFIPEFIEALTAQLISDETRWGDTWLIRTRAGQEERTIASFNNYFDQYLNAGVPVPWLKIIGNALICWLREQHEELWAE